MKNNILNYLLIATSMLLIFSCGKDDDSGNGGTGGSTATKINISPVSKFEGDVNSTFDFKVRLSQESSETVTVNYATKDKSAVEVEDYIAQNGTLTFSAGITEQIISVEIVADTLKEGDEEFEVQLSGATNATIEKGLEVGTIRNDDTFLPGGGDGYTTPNSYPGMTLVWADEFNDPTINTDNWTHEIGTGASGWGNNELQYYTSSSDNSYISDGKLIIEAKEQNISGSNYSSARMITAGKQEFIYGRVDVRARLPEGQGIWPAIWMLGTDIFTQGWPACGEIDIMELVGHEPNKVHGTAHWGPQGSSTSTFEGNGYSLTGGKKFSDEFNVFSIIWEENSIKWLVNDVQFFTITDANITNVGYPFNDNFFFILNVAVGGNWPGSPDNSTVFPQRMFVDYIRVFQ